MQIVKNPFVFIGMVAISAALLLSIFSEYTSETVKKNKELDKRKNILLARYFEEAKDPNSAIIAKLSEPQELIEVYKSEIEELLFLDTGNDVVASDDFDFSKLVWKENKKDGSLYYFFKGAESDKRYLPLFKVKGQDGGYIVPENGNEYTVKGISFYEHGETPGLGGEIDVYDVKARYLNKKIDLNNDKTPEMVKAVSDERYQLDYISGATITSDGLNQFIGSHILGRYKSILSEVSE